MTDPFPGATGRTVPGQPSAEERAASTPLGELLSEVSRDLSTLFRQEVALAKAELTDSAKKAGKGAGMFGGAGVAGLFALLFLSIAAWWGLGYLIGNAWSAVVIAVVYAVVAAILATRGRKEIKHIDGAPQTVATVKEVPETLKPNTGRN
ncbi:phage holin family protein [Curtobacterium sp. PsM8]|uniref:phage holin family protein n=1 Tax=Curtobacterium sp. PsM8 TaxID=3030532 RepID=UPI00263BBE6C|nr:phage holin family protein [Curtobacterium sp. PsM8]MDN4647695.1 phage holin family protein [Curtobacterium sp. PsM8]